jgi:hypothetical protein
LNLQPGHESDVLPLICHVTLGYIFAGQRVLNESIDPKDKIIDGDLVRILNSTARVDAHNFPRIKTKYR